MTNKEAIYRQDVLDLAKKGVLISNGNYECVCKAINELPPVNPQPCEDAISRQYLIDIATKDGAYDYVSAQEIANAPPVTPQPKTGHWSHDGSHWKNRFICSGCGYKLFDEPTNYCPNCGAKMVESQESEDKE